MARNRLNNKYYLYFSYCILVYLVLNIQSVYSQDNYLKCVTINEGKLEEDLLCLNATFYSDCDVDIKVTSMHNIILEGKLNLELSRKLCTTDQVCIMCVEFTDFHVYSEEDEYALVHTNAEGCLSFFTFCIAPGMGSSIDFGCFDFEDTSLSHCINCPANCGGELHGVCNDGRCVCNEGWGDVLCLSSEPIPPDSNCIDIGPPFNTSACSLVLFDNCNAEVNITVGGDSILNFTIPLLESSQVNDNRTCQTITFSNPNLPQFLDLECEVCIEVVNITEYYSDDIKANEISGCLTISTSNDCFLNNFISITNEGNQISDINIGCFNTPSSLCGGCNNNCTGNGKCVESECECNEGWSGWSCEYPICEGECNGVGKCISPNECECDEGYYGENCTSTCIEESSKGSGIKMMNKEWYFDEPLSSSSPWRSWVEVRSFNARLDLFFFVNSSLIINNNNIINVNNKKINNNNNNNNNNINVNNNKKINNNNVNNNNDNNNNNNNENYEKKRGGIKEEMKRDLEEEIEWQIILLYSKDCPPNLFNFDQRYVIDILSSDQYYNNNNNNNEFYYDINDENEMKIFVPEISFNFLENCQVEEDYLVYFALYLVPINGENSNNQNASLTFSINSWASAVNTIDINEKVIGETQHPHLSYYSFPSFPHSQINLIIKLKNETINGSNDENLLNIYIQKNSCPLFPIESDQYNDKYYSLFTPIQTDSQIYPLLYNISLYNNEENSTWYFYLQSKVTCENYYRYFIDDNKENYDGNNNNNNNNNNDYNNQNYIENNVIEDCDFPIFLAFSIEITEIYHCFPPCDNGATCSQITPNDCVCPNGFTGDICDLYNCAPSCGPHGFCDGPNHCVCEEGWTGELCIDIDRSYPDIPLAIVKSGNGWIYLAGICGVIFVVLIGVSIVYFKQNPKIVRFIKRKLTFSR